MANHDLVKRIQDSLKEAGLPAWLFYGFHEIDPIALRILRFGEGYHATRRWFYLVPAEGSPTKLVHRIESGMLDHLPGDKTVYLRWQELRQGLKQLLKGTPQAAMQYSSLPYISRVDAGTVDQVREAGCDPVSSENLVQIFEAVWSPAQLKGHHRSAEILTRTVNQAFEYAAERLRKGERVPETDIQDFILRAFEREDLVTDSPPIVGVDEHAGNPHYSPTAESHGLLEKDRFLLIDLWAKENKPGAVFADITWTAYFGSEVPDKISQVFEVVRSGRDAGFELLRQRWEQGAPVEGWEVDDAARKVISEAGYGDDFVHRLGHNLGEETHGNGVNFDNLETHDVRQVIPGIGCTIEPGVYLPEFGIRSEIDVYMDPEKGPQITTPPQNELLRFDI
ncbi:MAG TPA: M24 family metallopeptidase [Acidobacteriota bacterium]|nr:M24 family metallopeptidase [Acidobacteriota bacterium]